MTQPILAFQSSSSSSTGTNPPKTTPNLLPCRIHHDGSVEPTESFWNPRQEDGVKTAYFRGRKLHGQTLSLPEGYKGVVASKSIHSSTPPSNQQKPRLEHEMSFVMENSPEVVDLEAEEERGKEPGVGGQMEVQAEFEEVIVWGHETLADAVGDPYVRGVEEWIAFASKIHGYD